MRVNVIAVPYDLGRGDEGMGRGPRHWLEAGIEASLAGRGHDVGAVVVERGEPYTEELKAIEAVNRAVASAVRDAVEAGAFPLVLSGNCNSSMGTLGGVGPDAIGAVWFDAHGDFNTPETSPSGFFDGLALAIATGACHRSMWDRVARRPPLPESHVVLAAVRDIDPGERERFEASAVTTVPAASIRSDGVEGALGPALDALGERTDSVYLHIDLDALDPEVARVNRYQVAGGLSVDEMVEAIAAIGGRFRIRAAALTAFDPESDSGGRGARAGIELAGAIVEAVNVGRS